MFSNSSKSVSLVITAITFGGVFLASTIPLSICSSVSAQDTEVPEVRWVVYPMTIMEEVPHTETEFIEDTAYDVKKHKTFKPVWRTETRQRRIVTQKPVTETGERIVKKTLLRPVTITKYRDREVKTTEYRDVTRYRDETYTVRKPIVETGVRDEIVRVQKPVVEKMVEVKKTTSYKPVTETKTEYVAQPGEVGVVVAPDYSQRPRLRYLTPGYYTDPVTGMTVYRRRGLHWSTPNAVAGITQTPPTIVPQERTETRYVPETTEERRPFEVTRMVESTETRKVPFSIEKTVETTETRKVPYTVQEPIVTTRIEQVPYTVTEYREEIVTQRVPYTETVMKEEVSYEPYEIEVGEWEEKITTTEVPRKVQRKVTRESTKNVPKFVLRKVPFDRDGNQLSPPMPLDEDDRSIEYGGLLIPADQIPSLKPNFTEGVGSTLGKQPQAAFSTPTLVRRTPSSTEMKPTEPQTNLKSVMDDAQGEEAMTDNNSTDASEENQTGEESENPVPPVSMPESGPSNESGDENAADRKGETNEA